MENFQELSKSQMNDVKGQGGCKSCQAMIDNINNDYNKNVRADGIKYMIMTVTHWVSH